MSARVVFPRVLTALATAAALALVTLGPTTADVSPAASRLLRRTDVTALQPEDLGLDKDALRRTASARPKSGAPPHPMACGDVSLVIDGFGGFGSASAGGDAHFDAGDGAAATVFEAMAHLRGAGFLDADSLMIPQSEAHSSADGDAVAAWYVRGPFRFDLRSRLVDCGEPHSGALVQDWLITNLSSRAQNLGFTQYVDGDLFFEGDHRDDFGVLTADATWQFDQRATGAPAAYLQLTSVAPAATEIRRQVGEYSDQRRRINRNETLRDGLWRGTGAPADADGDGVTDEGFDVSLAIGHEFGPVAPGAVVTVTTRLQWGVARISDVLPQELALSLGPDREAECEGHEGTLVALAAALEPADAAVSHEWTVDGIPAGGGAELQALLAPGEHLVAVTVTDDAGVTATDDVLVRVRDTQPPVPHVSGDLELWPPDHRLVALDLSAVLTAGDACSATTAVRVLSVTSSEPDDALGDGRFSGDAVVIDGRAWVRRERSGLGFDRVYTVVVEVSDEAGNLAPATVLARVPHDRGGR